MATPAAPAWQVRRLRSADLTAFRELQQHAVHYARSKVLHNKWMVKAVRELLVGERVGYGLFDTGLAPASLLACILLRCTSSNIIELKDLVVGPSCGPRGSRGRDRAYRELVEHAERASIYRGFSRLEVELLSSDHEQLDLFLSRGYTIESSQETVPAIGVPQYLLWKQVPPEYHGDPFDHLSMARWLLAERLHWSVAAKPEPVHFGAGDLQQAFRLRFEVQVHPGRRGGQAMREDGDLAGTGGQRIDGGPLQTAGRIAGDCIVDAGKGDAEEFAALLVAEAARELATESVSERPAVRLVVSRRRLEGLAEAAGRVGFRAVLGSALLQAVGYSSGNAAFDVDEGAIRGLLLYVGPADLKSLRAYCSVGAGFSYVILNGVGEAVYLGLARDEAAEYHAVFCTDAATANPEDERRLAIVGWAQVEDVVPRRSDMVEEELRDRQTLWHGQQPASGDSEHQSRVQVAFWVNQFSVNFQENDMVHVLHLEKPRWLKEEVALDEVGKDDLAVRPLLADAKLYGLSACYATGLVAQVLARPCSEWEAMPAARDETTLELELLKVLEESVAVIGASRELQNLVTDRILADQLGAVARQVRDQASKIRRAVSARPQRSLFEGPEDAAALLRSRLRAVRTACTEFYRSEASKREERMGRASPEARSVCSRLLAALDLVRPLGLGVVVPGLLQRWVATIAAAERTFLVGLTFSSEHRTALVEPVARALAERLTEERVFYDGFHTPLLSQLAASDLLADIYMHQCELVVVFLSSGYGKGWSGKEWTHLVRREPHRVLLLKIEEFDHSALGIDDSNDLPWDIRVKNGPDGYLSPVMVCDGILDALDRARRPRRAAKTRRGGGKARDH